MRRIHTKARDGRETFDGVLMDAEQLREFLTQVSDMRVNHVQFIEGQRQQVSVDRMQIGAGPERVAQLIRRRV